LPETQQAAPAPWKHGHSCYQPDSPPPGVLPQVLRTPIVRGTSPLWNWQLDLKLPAPLGQGLYDEVARLTVYDVHTLGDPVVVGTAEVSWQQLGAAWNSLNSLNNVNR
jgi:hypothetical protein